MRSLNCHKSSSSSPYYRLYCAPHCHIEGEGEPESVVAHAAARHEVYAEERYGGSEHGAEHSAGHGTADEHAVPNECRHACHGHQHRPEHVFMGGKDNAPVAGEQRDEGFAAEGVGQGEAYCHACTPAEQRTDGFAERLVVACTVAPAAYGFAGIGKAVHDIREHHIELHEQGVDGEHRFALARTGRGEEEHYADETERAQEYVAVHRKEAEHPVVPLHAWLVAVPVFHLGEAPLEPHQRHAETCPLGYHRA